MNLFNEVDFVNLLLEITNETSRLEKEARTRSYSLFRRNDIFNNPKDYLYSTIKISNNKNKLLFNGELDFITGNIYEILTIAVLWKYFNTLNEAYLNIAKIKYNNKNLILSKNYGITYYINSLTKNPKSRIFESISNPLVLFKTLNYLNQFRSQFNLGNTLYKRFEFYGFIDYLNNISNPVDYSTDIEQEMISKFQVYTIKLNNKYPFLDRLDSIFNYSQLLSGILDSSYLDNSIENIFIKNESKLLDIILKNYQNVISLCFNLHFPISISHSYSPVIPKKE